MSPDVADTAAGAADPTGTLDRFLSFAAARSRHAELLKLRMSTKLDDADIRAFAAQLQATGVVISDETERSLGQSMLDYWDTILDRNGDVDWSTPLFLAAFDASQAPQLSDDDCPYVGLHPFGVKNQKQFFGRDALVKHIAEQVTKRNLVIVVGPSGSGKSSLLRAGVLPVLAKDPSLTIAGPVLLGTDPLRSLSDVVRAIPSTEPVSGFQTDPSHLRRLLSALSHGQRTLLVVDQMEELFTLCPDETVRDTVLALVAGVIVGPERTHKHGVLISIREDYAVQLRRNPVLAAEYETALIPLGPLDAKSLREVIEEPARQIGLHFEAGIVEDLVAKVLGEPAALPLLQFTLMELWNTRRGNIITWAAYNALGSPRTALSTVADSVYEALLPEEQLTAKRIFTRLVQFGDSLEVTSRRVLVTELEEIENPARVRQVIRKFVARRLLRLSDSDTGSPATLDKMGMDQQIEVAHEALIRNWKTLTNWLEDASDGERQRRQLRAAAALWQAHRRDRGGLIGGSLLIQAKGYTDLTPLEQELVKASEAGEKRTHRRQIIGWALAAGSVGGLGSLATFLVRSQSEEERLQDALRAETEKLRQEQERLKVEQEKLVLEQRIIAALRPLLRVEGGTFVDPPRQWDALNKYRDEINRVTAAVGFIHSTTLPMSTGFLVGDDVMIASHLDDSRFPLRATFSERSGNFEQCPFDVVERLAKFSRPHHPKEYALYRLRPRPGGDSRLPAGLAIADNASLEPAAAIYSVGYPHFEGMSDGALKVVVGDTIRNAKRLQPGRVIDPPLDNKVTYDISAFAGSAGGPLVTITTGRVFGIHYGRDRQDHKLGIMLGDLMGRDRAIALGVKFDAR